MANLVDFDNDKCYELSVPSFNYKCSCSSLDLGIFHSNIRSLGKNFDALQVLLSRLSCNFDLIGLSETWSSSDHFSEQLVNYIRLDGSSGVNKSSGVSLFLSKRIKFKQVFEYKFSSVDSVFVTLDLEGGGVYLVGLIYRSPASDFDVFMVEWFAFLAMCSSLGFKVVVFGDFNINVRDFSNSRLAKFLQSSNEFGFKQMVQGVTRPNGDDGTVIDLLFTNLCCSKTVFVLHSQISDHYPFVCIFDRVCSSLCGSVPATGLMSVVDWDGFVSDVASTDFGSVLACLDVNVGVGLLTGLLQELLSNRTSFVKRSRRFFCPRKPWLSKGLLKCIRKREKMKYKLNKNGGNVSFKEKYVRYRNTLSCALKASERRYFANRISSSSSSSKALWEAVGEVLNKGRDGGGGVPDFIETGDGVLLDGPVGIANAFNEFFVNIGDNTRVDLNAAISVDRVPSSCFFAPASQKEVLGLIDGLKGSCTKGVDGISNNVLKRVKYLVLPALTHLVNLMFSSGVFPSRLKDARVRVIYKSGGKSNLSNYRPISVLNSLSKIFEGAIYNRLNNFMETQKVLCAEQFGFRKNRSTEDALVSLVNSVQTELDSRNFVGLVSLDIRKAFDSVNHRLLLQKLDRLGVRGLPFELLESYLFDRTQFVAFGDFRSDVLRVKCGVPQGSILGPLLFILFVNDIVSLKDGAFMVMYADDIVLYMSGKNLSIVTASLQRVLDGIERWYLDNGLRLNAGKCKYMVFCSPHKYNEVSFMWHTFFLVLGDVILTVERSVKYLGLVLDRSLKWHEHIAYLRNKLSVIIPTMYRLRSVFSKKILMVVYYGLFQSAVQYGILLYGSTHKSKLAGLLILQKKILRVINYVPYNETISYVFREDAILNVYNLNICSVMMVFYRVFASLFPLPSVCLTRCVAGHDHFLRNTVADYYLQPRLYSNDYGRFSLSFRLVLVANFMIRQSDIFKEPSIFSRKAFRSVVKHFLLDSEINSVSLF